MEDVLACVDGLSDAELIARLQHLARRDRALSAKLLVHLGEVDARGLYREHAYSSMFEYAVSALRMSEAEAYLRIHAARLGRRFPLIVELLGHGLIHLTAIKLLGPHLTLDNHAQLLERAQGKRKRELEALVAEIAPRPDVPNRMRKLPSRDNGAAARDIVAHAGTPATSESTQVAVPTGRVRSDDPTRETARAAVTPSTTAPSVPAAASTFTLQPSSFQTACSTPLRPGRYRLQVSIDQQAHDQLEQLKELLRHQIPNGDLAQILELAVNALHEKTLQQRFAQTRKPRVTRPRSRKPARRSRYIPRAVVREVHARDGGQCTFVSEDGRRCGERGFLELHHHQPYARGGASSTDNLRLMCRAHNALLAERDYGEAFMRSRISSCDSEDFMAQHQT